MSDTLSRPLQAKYGDVDAGAAGTGPPKSEAAVEAARVAAAVQHDLESVRFLDRSSAALWRRANHRLDSAPPRSAAPPERVVRGRPQVAMTAVKQLKEQTGSQDLCIAGGAPAPGAPAAIRAAGAVLAARASAVSDCHH